MSFVLTVGNRYDERYARGGGLKLAPSPCGVIGRVKPCRVDLTVAESFGGMFLAFEKGRRRQRLCDK